MSIRIDKEFESLIPPLTDDEFKQLEENCLRDGIRDPLILWSLPNGDNILVDGHNRWKIAAQHGGMSFTTKCMEFDDRDEAKSWIIRNQFGRRNLSAYDRSVLALKLKPLIAEKAKRNQASHTKQGYQKSDKAEHTAKELAKVAGVSHDTIRRVERIEKEAPEGIKQAVREGKLSINQAFNSTFPKREDPVKVAKREHMEYELNKSDVVDIREARIDKANQKIINNSMTQDVLRMIDAITKFALEYGPIKAKALAEGMDDDTASHILGMIKNCQMVLKDIEEAINRRRS